MVISSPGGPEVLTWGDVVVPTPGDDELLIRVWAAGINRHDCNQRRRGPTPAHSVIPGLEVSGEVVAVGRSVAHRRIGEAVCALVDGGGYGHYVIARNNLALPIPTGLDWSAAAALPEAAFTVWHNFFRLARLGPAESVLLHGGTSGVGTLAVQLLTALGHPVYATCGSPEKMDAALRLGAQGAFSYRDPQWVDQVKTATDGRGVDVILDMSGGAHSAQDVEALARHGRLLHLSPGNGAMFSAPLRTIMAKELSVTGSLLRPLPDEEKAVIASDLLRAVWPLIARGLLKPVVHAVLPLSEAAEGHRRMEAGEVVGKLVLSVSTDQVPPPAPHRPDNGHSRLLNPTGT